MKVIFTHAVSGERLTIVNVVTLPRVHDRVMLKSEEDEAEDITYRVTEVEHIIAPASHAIIVRVTE